jgi:anti-sigma factor RsiW
MRMTRDELEYAISQYLDGNLPLLEEAALEDRLASDDEARALLEEYRRLDATLKNSLPAAPPIAWDRLAGEIQKSLAAEETPVQHYSLGTITWAGRLAIAASVLFAVSIAIHFAPRAARQQAARPGGLAIVSGPQVQQSTGPVVEQIQIGPAPSLAVRPRSAEEDIVARPTVVLIDRANPSGQDGDPSMY